MTNMNTMIAQVTAAAAKEAGIKADELYSVNIISIDAELCEMVLETEWNTVTCYADMVTGEILGLMGEGKSTDEMLAPKYIAARTARIRKAA